MTAVNSSFLKLRQAADLLGVNYSIARRLVKPGHLCAFETGRSRKVPLATINAVVRPASAIVDLNAQRRKRLPASKNEGAIEP